MDYLGMFGGDANDGGEGAIEAPPGIDGDDRRAHLAAYDHWVSLRRGRACPSILDMDRRRLEGPRAILLELIGGNDPALTFVGGALLREAGMAALPRIGSVPAGSFLSLLVAHFPQVAATREPIAFEGEQVGSDGCSNIYRGILLPLAADGRTVDHVYGTISWRELAPGDLTAGIALEVGRAIAEAALAPFAAAEALAQAAAPHPELPLHA